MAATLSVFDLLSAPNSTMNDEEAVGPQLLVKKYGRDNQPSAADPFEKQVHQLAIIVGCSLRSQHSQRSHSLPSSSSSIISRMHYELPSGILGMIFDFVDDLDRLLVVERTCSSWYDASIKGKLSSLPSQLLPHVMS
jgi:hypothetical protein